MSSVICTPSTGSSSIGFIRHLHSLRTRGSSQTCTPIAVTPTQGQGGRRIDCAQLTNPGHDDSYEIEQADER
jgi:hypothetical protein